MQREKQPEKFALKLPNELLEQIEKAAKSRYMTRSEFVRQAIIDKLDRVLTKTAA
jgi:metal-responsive CopG/Arc/MetJ family transcriptional regulator